MLDRFPPMPPAHPTPGDVARRPLGSCLLVLSIAFAAGCGDALPGDAADAGVPLVVPETEEVFRIGSVSGESWEAFSRIVDAGFDREGNLYLLDAGSRSLTVVDPSGALVRTIGRAGTGPGEYRSPLAMAVLPDGRVAVSDTGHRSLLLFGADGGFLASLPFGEGAPPSILLPDGDDAFVYAARGVMMTPGAMGQPGPSDVPVSRIALGSAGEEATPQVLHRAWIPPRPEPEVSSTGGMTLVTRATRAFDPQLHVAVLPDGTVAVADSTTFRIDLVRAGSGVEQTIERPVAPTRAGEREQEREKARRLSELQDGGGPAPQVRAMASGDGGAQAPDPAQVRAMLEAQLESLLFWPEIAVIQELSADRDGRLWVRRFGDIGEPGPIEILGRDGGPLAIVPPGEFQLPAAFGPNGLAAWIELDELDVPFVRVARLVDLP